MDGTIFDSRAFEVAFGSEQPSSRQIAFFALKGKVVYVVGNRIYVVPLDHKLVEAVPQSLHFPVSKIPLLSIDAPQTIDLKAIGGKGKLNYRLVTEFAGLSVDSKTGVVTVDTPALWKDYLDATVGPGSVDRSSSRSSRDKQAAIKKQVEDLLGEPLTRGKFALTVPIQLAVTDDEAQQDQISFYAIVLGDKIELNKLRAEKKAAAEAAKEARMVEFRKREAAMTVTRNQRLQVEAGETEDKRLDEIESRLKPIESSLETILLKLESLKNLSKRRLWNCLDHL